MRTLRLACMVLALFAAATQLILAAEAQAVTQPGLSRAIRATLKTLPHGRGDRIDDYTVEQKVVVVTFFASWCVPCRQEFTPLQDIYTAYHVSGVKIVVEDSGTISRHFGTISRIPTLFVFDQQGQLTLHFFNKPDGSQPTIDLAALRQVITARL